MFGWWWRGRVGKVAAAEARGLNAQGAAAGVEIARGKRGGASKPPPRGSLTNLNAHTAQVHNEHRGGRERALRRVPAQGVQLAGVEVLVHGSAAAARRAAARAAAWRVAAR